MLRGVAIIAMIVYHFSWDLSAYQLIGVDVVADLGWRIFARSIASTFLVLVGVNLVLAARNGFRPGPYFRRLGTIAAAALLVSLGTWWIDPNTFVFFGILHLVVVASVLALPFLRVPIWLTATVAVLFLAGPYFLTNDIFNQPAWYWLGLSTMPPATVDYVPIFPWFGVVLLGVAAGRLIVDHEALPLWRWHPSGWFANALGVVGRWSLLIYLIHQPVLFGALYLVAPLIGPSQAALDRQLVTEYEATCATEGYDAATCSAYAQCILTDLHQHAGILEDAIRRELSQEERDLWEGYVNQCRAAILPPPIVNG